ncbi:MAG TPA: universal stress protein, partial [Dehalococcoidia bacterium]|nr:universal stress protein [Dehalococcoidia bacterium]
TSARPADGDVPEAIARIAKESGAELTMIATRGRSGMTRMLLGSVTTGVVHAIDGAMLVVKAGTGSGETPSVRRVLLTLDGSEQAEAAIPQAVWVTQGFGATLNLIQVAPLAATMLAGAPGVVLPSNLDEQIEQSAADYLRGAAKKLPQDLPVEMHVLRGPVADEILDHAEHTHADLIVMSTRGRSGVARWTLGSTADRVLRGGSTPVLLVRAQGEGGA